MIPVMIEKKTLPPEDEQQDEEQQKPGQTLDKGKKGGRGKRKRKATFELAMP